MPLLNVLVDPNAYHLHCGEKAAGVNEGWCVGEARPEAEPEAKASTEPEEENKQV